MMELLQLPLGPEVEGEEAVVAGKRLGGGIVELWPASWPSQQLWCWLVRQLGEDPVAAVGVAAVDALERRKVKLLQQLRWLALLMAAQVVSQDQVVAGQLLPQQLRH